MGFKINKQTDEEGSVNGRTRTRPPGPSLSTHWLPVKNNTKDSVVIVEEKTLIHLSTAWDKTEQKNSKTPWDTVQHSQGEGMRNTVGG
jgi:hypothetical protein